MSKEKVLIIGAGPAGLSSAYRLLKQFPEKYDVVILEESNEIGGISRTVRYNGNRMDIGGHRFFSKDREAVDFWKELMPIQGAEAYDDKKLGRSKPLEKGGPDPEKEDNVMLIRHRVSRIYYLRKFFDYPVSLKWQTLRNMGFLNTMKVGFGYLHSVLFKLPETSLENFYINRFGKKLYSMFFEGYTEKLWGRHPSHISADWGSQRVKGLSVRAILKDMFGKVFHKKSAENTETSLIEEFMYPKFGPGQLWERAAEEIEKMGGTIIRNASVKSMEHENGRITSVTYTLKGKKHIATPDVVISSMPLKDLVHGMSGVPANILDIASGLPYRDFVTIGVKAKKLELANKTNIRTLNNIVPDCWIYVQEPDVKLGRIQIFNNWSPYLVKDPDNTVWIGLEYFCNEGDSFWNMSDDESYQFAANELVSMGILRNGGEILDAHREKVKKAYPAYFDTYSQIDELTDFLNNIPNLYCVGRNGQHRYNNMDHSMITGFRAADAIHGDIPKGDVWMVNTDKEYHEEKDNEK